MRRTYVVNIQRIPAISGYGGYDEWTLENMTPEQADYFIERLQKLVDGCVKSFKLDNSGYTGTA